MKIAAVTVTCNDDHNVNQCVSFYEQYKSALSMHIIVDNGSDRAFVGRLEQLFPTSVIIKRTENRGTTAAYNDGIRHALTSGLADSIMLISSDVKITAKDIGTLHELLFSDGRYGIVAPILLRRDSCEIELYGAGITKDLRMDKENVGEVVTASLPLSKEVAAVPGGISLAKCEYYQQVGLQDERLFMYSDEVDMGIRMARAGLKAVVTRNAVAWHQHILRKNATWRGGYTEFLMRRNRIYLAYKHFGCLRGLYVFLRQIIRAPRVGVSFYRNGASGHLAYYVLGCMCGLFRIHRMPAMILEGRT